MKNDVRCLLSVVRCSLSVVSRIKKLNMPLAEELTAPLSNLGPGELIISGHM